MNAKQLVDCVEKAETHRMIVGDYAGAYSLGVTDNPPAFVLRVEPKDVEQFPTKVTINGVDVPVIIHGSFIRPVPTAVRR